jgi:hypothetical protein
MTGTSESLWEYAVAMGDNLVSKLLGALYLLASVASWPYFYYLVSVHRPVPWYVAVLMSSFCFFLILLIISSFRGFSKVCDERDKLKEKQKE